MESSKKNILGLAICCLLLMAFKAPPSEINCPTLTVSANKRYLAADGKPFFWLGDTGWLLLEKLNKTETEKYLETRRVQGFNVIQIMLLHSLSARTIDGDSALINKNMATPKILSANVGGAPEGKGYWENLDFVVDLAAKKGIYAAIVPVWGSIVRAGQVTEKQAEIYAGFLASRYSNKSNIIWVNGGDVRGDDSIKIWKTIGKTLKNEDPNHLVTYHPFGRTQSSMWFHNEAWLDFNMFQSGHRSYEQDTARSDLRYGEDNWKYVVSDYKKTPVKPTLDGEPSYEGMPHGLHDTLQPRWTDSDLRRYAYWSVFSGACGFTYGNNSVMQMRTKSDRTSSYGARETWEQAVNNPGACQMIFLKNLMQQYHFETLAPDQHVLADPGERYDHLTALRGKDYLLVYTWNGRNIVLKPELLKGNQYSVNWYSPRNGIFMNVGQIGKDEKFEFDPPGEKGNGNDWVLILIKSNTSSSSLTIPRDSSFTTYLTWLKLARDFPQAKIADEKLPPGLTVNYGVTYKTLPFSPYGKRELHLDVFCPQKAGQYPVLLLIHGGGWRSGNRTMENQMAQQIATHGYVTATVEYRLSPEAIYPAAVHDIKAAIRFLRSQAKKFSIDPDRFAISGTSAGGQLAALIGMTGEINKFDEKGANLNISAKIQAIIDIDGVLDFRDPNESAKDDDPLKPSAGAYWFGATYKQAPQKWTEASPIIYAGKNTPPIMFVNSALPRFHAGRDSMISIINRNGIYSEVHTIENTPHPFWLFHPWFELTVDYMVSFLDKVLK